MTTPADLKLAAKELDRQQDRYEQPMNRFWLYFVVDNFRVNVETDEATYRQAHKDEFGTADDITQPIEPSWWNIRTWRLPFRQERGGWTE